MGRRARNPGLLPLNGQAWSLVGKPDVPGASDPTRSLDLAVTGGCGFWAVGVESAGGAPRAYAERYLPCAGTWTVYGVGVGGVAPPPVLRGVGCPVLNTVIAVEVTGAPSGLGLCALGFQRAAVPFLGGQLLVGGGVVDSLMCPIDAGGRGRLELGLPAVPALAGLDAQVQGFFLDASASGGVAMSAGLEISVR